MLLLQEAGAHKSGLPPEENKLYLYKAIGGIQEERAKEYTKGEGKTTERERSERNGEKDISEKGPRT